MQFCPKCENLLYPTKNGLHCKFCSRYYKLKKKQLIPYLNMDENLEFKSSGDLEFKPSGDLEDNIDVKELDEKIILKINKIQVFFSLRAI